MRLPWPFQRFQRAPAPDGAASVSAPAGSRPSARDEWRQLPPLTETLGPTPLIAPTAPFAADLHANQPMPPVLAPLSHARALDAPSGIVLGIARPVERAPASAAPPLLQRRPAGRRQGPVAAEVSWTEPAPPDPVVPQAAVPVVETATPTPEPLVRPRYVAAVTPQPGRASLQLARMSAADHAALPLQRAGVVGQPRASGRPIAGLPSPGPSALAAPSPIPTSPAPQPALNREPTLPLPGPISRKPAGGLPTEPLTLPIASGRPTLGQSRRLGLGAPITSLPAGVQPTVTPPAAPLDLPRPSAVQRKAQEAPRGQPAARTETSTKSAPQVSSAPAVARPLSQAAPRPATVQSAPLVSARPLRTRVQRAPLTASRPVRTRDEPGEDGAAPVSASPVKVHRGTVASEMAETLDAKAFTHQGEIYLPPSAGPMGSPTARSLIAHEMTHVAQQRAYGSRLPQEHTSHGQDLEQKAAAAERHPDLPLAQPPARATEPTEHKAEDMAAAQRKPSDGPRSSSVVESTTINFPTRVQRAPDDKGSDRAALNRDAANGNGKKSETELEELAGQLYTRISRRLRRELLVDRERAGLMVDLP